MIDLPSCILVLAPGQQFRRLSFCTTVAWLLNTACRVLAHYVRGWPWTFNWSSC